MPLSDWLFGRPLATGEEGHQRVGVWAGIPMLGLDALASAAYGPEAALTLLIPAGLAGAGTILPVTAVIVGLMGLVYVSYRQTITAYPTGGGSYTVAKENLGTGPGLLAAAALMLDYVLVVAVGISAGVGALVSAVPALQPYTVALCLAILGLIAGVNLRGVRESGLAFAAPTYLFIVCLLGVLGWGVWKAVAAGGRPAAVSPPPLPTGTAVVGWWLVAKAFASGCTAMTGVEAVSNGVAAFRAPAAVSARRTLTVIIGLLAVLLLGIAYLCRAYGIAATEPGRPGYDSVLSQVVAAVAGRGAVYYVTIAATLAVLALSANTGFADFPRLCRAVAADGYLPAGFAHRGRRLVYSQGIVVLAALSGALLVFFAGVTDHLIPLFAVGAFLAFTLSQFGMVVHWRRTPGPGRRAALGVNAVGGAATGVALVMVLVSKFADGAWVTLVLLPAAVAGFYSTRRHYRAVAREVASDAPLDLADRRPPVVLVLVRGWSAVGRKAVKLAVRLSPEVYALHVADDEFALRTLEEQWAAKVAEPCRAAGVPAPKLIVVPSPFRRLYGPLMDTLADLEKAHPDRAVAVVLPELVERRWYHYLLHNQTAAVLKGYLYFSGRRRVSVVNVPWYLGDDAG